MSWIEAIILGIVQGATEFLPISSTAHLRVVPALMGWPDPQAAFSAVIQCGTLVAVVIYFRRDLQQIANSWFRDLLAGQPLRTAPAREGWMILIGTLPIVIVGLVLKKQIESTFRSLYVVAGALFGFGLVMLAAEAFAWWRRSRQPAREIEALHAGDAAAMGLAQALALVPGVSRSGATISAGLAAGLSREAAARFSFLLSLPAIFAAAMLELVKARHELLASADDAGKLLLATVVAGLVGYAAIAWLLAYVRRHTTAVFVVYRWLLAGLLLWWLSTGRLTPLDTPSQPTRRPRPSLLARQRDDAVPVFGRRAIVLGDEDGEEIFDPVFGRHAVQSFERLRPAAGQQFIECQFVVGHILVAESWKFALRRQQLRDFQAPVHAVRFHHGHAAHAGDVGRDRRARTDRAAVRSSSRMGACRVLVILSSRDARLTTGPKTVTFT